MLDRRRQDRRGGLATDVQVGETLTFEAAHGTGRLRFSIDAKDVGECPPGGGTDSVQVVLTIDHKQGQLARVRVHAPSSVRVVRPKAVEA